MCFSFVKFYYPTSAKQPVIFTKNNCCENVGIYDILVFFTVAYKIGLYVLHTNTQYTSGIMLQILRGKVQQFTQIISVVDWGRVSGM